MRRTRLLILLLALLAVGSASAQESSLSAGGVETVILISLDGTLPRQIAAPGLPTLARLQREGAHAQRLVPVFPANTFPNHVTFVTGVSPWRHGIVNNVFVDSERGKHSYENDPSWLQTEPLWSLLARRGIVSAAFHWVGSQGAWTSGLGPRHWVAFDGGTPEREKVEQILAWLDEPDPEERPRLVTSWFHGADGSGHRHGPDAPEVHESLVRQDAELGRLVEGLSERGRLGSSALILVSDHGMAKVKRRVDLFGALREAGLRATTLGGGGFATVRAASLEDARGAVDVARSLGLEAWLREETPPELPADNPRFGDALVVAPVGVAMDTRSFTGRLRSWKAKLGLGLGGSHGHRPDRPEMAGIFVAFGAGVPAATDLGTVHAVDVAPTVLSLLGVPIPDWMEGRPRLGSAVSSQP